MTSVINKLQEIYQTKQLPLPEYTFQQKGDKFQCTVTLSNIQKKFIGEEKTNKKEAKCSATEQALSFIRVIPEEKEIKFNLEPNDAKCILLIDLENIKL